jgi:hypothetical protein
MRFLVFILSLFALSGLLDPSNAKPIWFQCGYQKINLDEEKSEYVIEDGNTSYKGVASFFPNIVRLELVWREWSPNQNGIKYIWNIDRRTLGYEKIGEINQDTKGFATNKGWVKNSNEVGSCIIIKDPYKNRKF